MAASPRISIIFVNYQSVWSLSVALRSLFSLEARDGSFEIIVFNNDQTEARALKQLAHQAPFRLIESEKNVGFGQAINRASVDAEGSILGFLNPDTKWLGKNLAAIEAFLGEQPKDTLLGLRLIDAAGKPEFWSKGRFPTLWSAISNKFSRKSGLIAANEKKEVHWVSGGAIFLHKENFLALGGFSEEYFLYFEDVDFCFRFTERGGKVLSDPRFFLEHNGGKSFRSRLSQKQAYYQSQATYFKQHRPKAEWLVLRLFHRLCKDL